MKIKEEIKYEHSNLFEDSFLDSSYSAEFESKNSNKCDARKHIMRNIPRTKGSIKKRLRPQNLPRSNVERRRRVRCHRCEPCTRDDCGECKYCKDMKKFGGTGISKQCCLSKQCLQPLLPTTTTCMLCEAIIDRKHENETNIMYECDICFEIYHAKCFRRRYGHLSHIESIVNEDLNNCWKCANCLNNGYIKQSEHPSFNNNNNNNNNNNSNSLKLIDNSLKQQLSLNTSSNFSDSLNNSFNSSRTNDMFVSPLSITIETEPPVKKKRHRRTKLEILSSKNDLLINSVEVPIQEEKKSKAKKSINKKQSAIISIDSLSNYEKQIILNEFCEIYDPVQEDHQEANDHQDDVEYDNIIAPDEDNNSSAASIDNNYSTSTQNSFSNFMYSENDDEDNFSVKYFDENEFDLLNEQNKSDDREEKQQQKENNNKMNSSESLLKMIQAN